jgi:hypothetical protein
MATLPQEVRRVLIYFVPEIALDNIEKRLRRHTNVAGSLITLGFLFSMFGHKLKVNSYFESLSSFLAYANWKKFVDDKGMTALLAFVVILMFYNFRRNTRAEIEIMAEMFSSSRTPQCWDRVYGQRQLIWLTAMWLAAALFLVGFVDYPRVFAATVMFYGVCNICGMVMYRKNIAQFVSDPRFLPPNDDAHKAFILQRREIQSIYLERRHHLKEAMLIAGAALAFVTAGSLIPSVRLWSGTPFAILIVVLLSNELVVGWWRRQREKALIMVDVRQIRSDKERMNE